MVKPEKKHWYLLSFNVQHPGAWIPASFVHGFNNMRVTIPELRVAKQLNHLGDNSVMLAVCYMGYATEREINGIPEIDPPSFTSEYFREGLVAASQCDVGDSIQPVNPYSSNVTDPQVVFAASEWKSGFDTFRDISPKAVDKAIQVLDKPTELNPPKGADNTKPNK